MKKHSVAVLTIVSLLVSGFIFSASALGPNYLLNGEVSGSDCVLQSFDRESCEQSCRSRYGVDPYELQRWGADSRPGYYVYASCIQGCNLRFWKEFDRNTRELERERVP
ncbi:MAG TPA: hypothetical protein VK463_09280 [Desulfomonilaceae bacterium]|nr:hypothetical protein [Desulfomonilaceae bacterium]